MDEYRSGDGKFFTVVAAAVVALIVVIATVVGVVRGYDKTTAGEVAVVRNGGWFDNNQIRQLIDPGSPLTWTGFWSSVHRYPAQQRFYTITALKKGGDRSGVDVVHVPTADGVNVGIEGTVYFTLNLDHKSLVSFDNKFGTRKFRALDGTYRYAWEGDAGWSGFLDQIVRPVIDNALREQVNGLRCVELVSSCNLVQNNGNQPRTISSQSNNDNISVAQQGVADSLKRDLHDTLRGDFLTDIKFNLVQVTLPASVQDAVDKAQAAFANVTESQAKVQQAAADALANKKRQAGYQLCPACAQIDTLKAIPPTVQTFAPGAGFAITSK